MDSRLRRASRRIFDIYDLIGVGNDGLREVGEIDTESVNNYNRHS